MATDIISISSHPDNVAPQYRSTHHRAPQQPSLAVPAELGPIVLPRHVHPDEANLLTNSRIDAEPHGERMIVHGQLLDASGDAVGGALIEVWQANAAGRYAHDADNHDAPLDNNFTGVGRAITDASGTFRFVTIRPGAYPWANHDNAWRPPHIHFSVMTACIEQRLVTQMYFPGDPLLAYDPIYQAVPDHAKPQLIASFDLDACQANYAIAYKFDIVVCDRPRPHS